MRAKKRKEAGAQARQPAKAPAGQKQKTGLRSRKLALEILLTVERENAYANLALAGAFRQNELAERDRAFVTALVQGVTRHRLSLDESLAQLSTRPLAQMPAALKNVLRLGLYQLIFMPNLPPSAVLNTATELAKTSGHQGLGKFTNAILRTFLRQREADAKETDAAGDTTKSAGQGPSRPHLPAQGRRNDQAGKAEPPPPGEAARLSTAYSMPAWIVERWLRDFGSDETIALLDFSQSTPPLTVRTNQMAITSAGLEQIFAREGSTCRRGGLVESCLIIERPARGSRHKSPNFQGSPINLPGFAEGLFSVQDQSSAFVSIVTDPKPGEVVVDLCAAPGGKSLHMAEIMENRGRIIAVDVSQSRLNLIKDNRSRLELTNIETVACDGRHFQLPTGADRVLLDAPCSGTGVLNRRSDLRYQRQPGDLPQLVELQRQLLANAAKLVKPGGILVYSTCSIEAEENFDNIRWFLQNCQDFEGDDFAALLPAEIRRQCQAGWQGPACKTEVEMNRLHMIQLLPSRHGVSGFFIARLKRRH